MKVVWRDVMISPQDKSKISKQANAYVFFDDYCIDVHISKTFYKKGDGWILNKIINSIKIVSPYNLTIYDYFNFANSFFYNKNYRESINYYEKTLELQRKENKLDRYHHISVIDNLGMSYFIMRDYKAAILKFDMGLEKFRDYPTFYYNKARVYSKMGNYELAILNLKLAIKNRDKLINNEKLPDPFKDPVFSKIKNEKRFLDIVKNLSR
ncbi:MAG: tetratricopeptide repeat protein [Elusimicrobiota bacterium]